MTFKEIIAIILAAALADNCAFRCFLGITPVIGWSKKNVNLVMGLAVLAVMLVSELICRPLGSLLAAANIAFLRIPLFVMVILAVSFALGALAKLLFKKPLGVSFPFIALNSAVLGLAMNTLELGFGAAMLTALGSGLGFMLALFVFSGVSFKLSIHKAAVPKAFKGLPVELLAAGIISLALFAF